MCRNVSYGFCRLSPVISTTPLHPFGHCNVQHPGVKVGWFGHPYSTPSSSHSSLQQPYIGYMDWCVSGWVACFLLLICLSSLHVHLPSLSTPAHTLGVWVGVAYGFWFRLAAARDTAACSDANSPHFSSSLSCRPSQEHLFLASSFFIWVFVNLCHYRVSTASPVASSSPLELYRWWFRSWCNSLDVTFCGGGFP